MVSGSSSSGGGGSALGNFGPIVFQTSFEFVRTIEKLTRSGNAVFADHRVAIGKPVSEFTGSELDEITFPMTFNASLGVVPLEEVNALRAIMLAAEPQDLNIGGAAFGSFTLRSVAETVTHFLRGVPYIITVNVSIAEYVATVAGAGGTAQADDAAASGATGKGGPAKVAGSGEALRSRSMTPVG